MATWQQRAANLFWGHPSRTGGEPGWICQIFDDKDWPDDIELANVGPFPTMAAAFRAAEKAMKKKEVSN